MIFDSFELPMFYRGVKVNHRRRNKMIEIIGGDSETINGPPFTLQFYSEEPENGAVDIWEILECDEKTSMRKFLKFLHTLPRGTYSLYVHNLTFDIVSFFYRVKEELITDEGDFQFESQGWKIRGYFGPPCYAQLTDKHNHVSIHLLDTGAFFRGSLAVLSNIFTPDLPKLEMPKLLGKHRYSLKNKHFVDYAMRDAEIAFHIGKHIDKLHEEYDIQQTVSIAHFASKIFRHHFMTKDIPLPTRKIIYSSLASYHGGKNGLYVDNTPTEIENVYFLDIISAYPHAFTLLPAFSNPAGYFNYKVFGGVDNVPDLGVYSISGYVKPCKYPVLFDHNFKPLSGNVTRRWVTGWELNEALESGEFLSAEIYGYFYDTDFEEEPSPFKAYAEHFFKLKDAEKDPVLKYFYKIVLNSLYGKFIQTKKRRSTISYDIDDDEVLQDLILKAGGMFHPFIASLITGHTRAYVHRLEHKYKAIHTSTDGIMTRIKPKETTGLGGQKIEAFGKLLLFRNKLYILYDDAGNRLKYALHGFHAGVDVLEACYKTGIYEYEYIKVNKLRESLRRGLQVNNFEPRKAGLHL